jgi:hypothetical protein
MVINALIAIVWVAIFTLGTAYAFGKAGVIAGPASWAAAVANGVWGYCGYRATHLLISRLDRLAFSRRVLVYLALIALVLVSVVIFFALVRLLNA